MNRAAPTKTVAPLDQVIEGIQKQSPQITEALPSQIASERFIRFAITHIRSKPELVAQETDRMSLYKAILMAAQDGLMLDGREAVLVAYNNRKTGVRTVSYQPMVAGLIKKAYNGGKISTITPMVVYKGDEFDFYVDETGEKFIHRPHFGNRSDENITHAYVVMKNKNGHASIEIMTREEIEQNYSRGAAQDNGPWATDFPEMCKKTVIKRAYKRWPSSPELQAAIDTDNLMNGFGQAPSVSGEDKPQIPAPPKGKKTAGKSSRLSQAVETAKKASIADEDADPPQEMFSEERPLQREINHNGG